MSAYFNCDSFNFSLFSYLLSAKNSLLISFSKFFGQLISGSTRENKYLFISKMENLQKRGYIYNSCIKSKMRRKLENLWKACKKKVSEFKISELITSFSTPSPWSLAFTILLMTTMVFFIVITIGKVRDPGTLSYLTENS